jgi:predicted phage tail protein
MTSIIGSKGGCFRRGSLVQLEHGLTKPIEEVQIGDEILSFNEKGEVFVSKVVETHFHEDPEPLLRVRFWNGSIDITPNHWVLNQYNNFIDIGGMTNKDALVDGMGHLRPIISAEVLEAEPVYNLTVEPNHTFICNNVRVHNGGYAARYPIVGSKGGGGGKGGGGSRPAVEAPDSLRSIAYAQVVDLLCEGEIEGLVAGEKSIYLNEVPLMNFDGTYNFSGFSWDTRTGTQQQSYIAGFSNVESVREVNTRIKGITPVNGSLPQLAAEPVERTYSNSNGELDGVRLTIGVPQLFVQDTTTGDTNGTSVELEVHARHITTLGADSGWYPASIRTIWENAQSYTNTTNATTITTNTFSTTGLYISVNFSHNSNSIFSKLLGNIITYDDITYTIQESTNGGAWTNIATGTLSADYSTQESLLGGIISVVMPELPSNQVHSLTFYSTVGAVADRAIRILTSGNGICTSYMMYKLGYDNKISISGKASSRYQRSVFVPFGQPGTWMTRVSRNTNESIKGSLGNQTWLDLETEITYGKFRYPNSAIVGISIDSSQFDSIPNRAYDVKLLKIKVPVNYDPLKRTYTGPWDGTFKIAWSNNPAWCLYDLITNDRYGLGNYIDDALVDKWALYTIGQYCDEPVISGLGDGLIEPRFTCNMYIQSREDAFKVLNDMASIFRGMLYWSAGTITAIQDAPADASHLFSQANVIDGVFTYSGSSEKTRHTVALVTWNDMKDMCRPKVEYVQDDEAVKQYGIIETDVIAVGCTSRGQAHRVGEWILYTEKYETDVVSFKTGLEGATARPGNIIKVADPARAGVRLGGRVVQSIDTTHIKIDSAMEMDVGETYTFNAFKADGTIQSATISSINSENILTLSTALPELPQVGSIWVAYADTVEIQQFRVLAVTEEDNSIFSITAVKHEPTKYSYIENGTQLEQRDYSNLSANPATPQSLTLVESLYATKGNVVVKLSAAWEPVQFANRYKLMYKRDVGNWSEEIFINTPQADLNDVVPGTYEVKVWALNAIGRLTLIPATATAIVYGKTLAPPQISGINTSVSDTSVLVSWNPSTEIDIWGYEVRTSDTNWGEDSGYIYRGAEAFCKVTPPTYLSTDTYYIKAIDSSGNYSGISSNTTSVVYDNILKTATIYFNPYVYTPYPIGTKIIVREFIPYNYNGVFTVTNAGNNFVTYSLDIPTINQESVRNYGNILTHSDDSKTSVSNSASFYSAPVPTVFLGTIDTDFQETSTSSSTVMFKWVQISPLFGLDYYEFTNGNETPIRVNATYVTIPANWTSDRTLSWVVVDKLGNRSNVTNKLLTIGPPGQMPSPTISLTKISNEVVMNFTWDPPTQGSLPVAGYEIRVDDQNWGDSNYIYSGMANTAIVPNIINSLGQTWYIKAFDTRNNYSVLARSILLDDLVPPSPPTLFANNAVNSGLELSWTESESLDVVAYEVRTINSGWGTNDADRVYYGTSTSTIVNLLATGTYTYYIKARDATNRWSTAQSTQFIYNTISPIVSDNISVNFFDDQATAAQVRLNWPEATPQFGVKYYRIVYSGLDFVQTATNFITQANWIDTKDFSIYVIDNNGVSSAISTKTITRYRPAQVGEVTVSVNGTSVVLSWPSPTISSNSGYLPISAYEVRIIDEDWGLGNFIYKGNATSVTVPVNAITGNGTWYIKAIDTDNEYSSVVRMVAFTADIVPNITGAEYSYFDTSSTSATVTLTWSNNLNPQFGLKHYKVAYNSTEYVTNSNTITLPADWVGNRQFTIYTVDNLRRESTGYVKTVEKLKPVPPTNFFPQVIDNTVMLTWTSPEPTSLPVSHYVIRTGANWATALDLGRKDGAFTTITELKKGTYTYWIATVDTDNVESDPISRTAEVAEPPDFVYHGILNTNYAVINSPTNGNTIAVDYTNAVYDPYTNGSVVLPVNITEQYQQHFTSLRVYSISIVSGGTGYAIGDIVEINGGTNTIKAHAKVLTLSGSAAATLQIIQPGNYTVAPGAGTTTTTVSGSGSGLTVTVATHAWTSPDSQVSDGYTKFISPTVLSGSYSETWDIGTILGSSKIITSLDRVDSGALTIIPKIEISSWANSGERWTGNDTSYKAYPGVWEVFGVNFRYVRITLTVNSADANDVVQFHNLNVLLNAKSISDAATAAVTSQGQVINFNKEFIDVTSLIVTPNSSSSLTTVYDYKDTVLTGAYTLTSNSCTVTATGHGLITGQNVRVYFSSGTALSGIFTITSYTANTFTFTLVGSNTSGNAIGYPQSFRVYLFNSSTGSPPTFGTYNVSWFVKGY